MSTTPSASISDKTTNVDRYETPPPKGLIYEKGIWPRSNLFFDDHGILSKAHLEEVLAKTIEDHNSEQQEGRLNGISPKEAWQKSQLPTTRDVRRVKVGHNGITLHYGKRSFIYHDGETGKRVGKTVLAWFNPESSHILVFMDLEENAVFRVQRSYPMPVMEAPQKLPPKP